MTKRVLAVGLDAAGLSHLETMIARGCCPTLGHLLAQSKPVAVTHPAAYRAELPWTSFLTGTPGESDYWGAITFEPATYQASLRGALRREPFYARLGVPVVVADVPQSVPWPGVDGCQLVAWGAHSPQHPRASEPAGLLAEIDRIVGAHPAFGGDSQPGWHSGSYQERLVEALVDGAGKRARAFRLLLARRVDWGFALVVFSELHSAGHLLWHGVDRGGHPLGVLETSAEAGRRYERVVRAVDAAVGEVLAGQQNDVQIVLFSVHGTAPNANDLPANYLVPELLQRVDFAWPRRSNPRPAVPRLVVPDANCSIGTVLSGGLRGPDRLRGPGPPSALGVLSARLRRRIRRLKAPADAWQSWPSAPGEGEARPSDQGESLAYLGACDYQDLWPWSRAFVLPSFSDAQVRVNLAGRESAGVVSSRDYASELQRVETLLRLARDPSTGRALDVEFERPRIGDHLARGGPPADLLARYADPVDCWDHPLAGKIGPYPYLRSGEHGGAGFLAVVGDNEPVNDLAVAELGPFLGRFFQPR